jgi:hypothetical protein
VSPVARFVLGYAAAFAAFSAAARERRAVAYFVVLGCAGAVAYAAHRVARFTGAVQWGLAGAGLLHLVGGLLPSPHRGSPGFYETWLVAGMLKYDQFVHFAVSAAVAFAAWELLGAYVDERRCPPAARAVLAALLSLGAGALNEGLEFLSALRFADAYVGGLENTGWDLVFNAFGAACAAVWLAATRALAPPAAAPARTAEPLTRRSTPLPAGGSPRGSPGPRRGTPRPSARSAR